jgi:hypothetical protein
LTCFSDDLIQRLFATRDPCAWPGCSRRDAAPGRSFLAELGSHVGGEAFRLDQEACGKLAMGPLWGYKQPLHGKEFGAH